MRKIGIYGGAFNPPHLGHVKAAESAARQLDLDMVVFVPTGNPPHKLLSENAPEPGHRLELARLAFQGPKAQVSDVELRRRGASYSVDTLEQLSQMYPQSELYMLMGADMFLEFDGWKNPERICRLCRIAAFCRQQKDLKQSINHQAEALKRAFDARIDIIDNDFVEISSTNVRRLLIFGGADVYLDKKVANYIYQNKLYRTGESFKNLTGGKLRQAAVSFLDKKRVPHVLGCEDEAVKLARRWGLNVRNARRAALLHDVTKALGKEQQLILCEKYGIMSDDIEKSSFKLLHPKTGAAVARSVFGENPEIVEGILWHTTGRAGMTDFEKIIYLADYIEPTRSMDAVERLRELAYEDLNRAMLFALDMAIGELERENKTLHPTSVNAWDYFRSITAENS